jgi:hypothetical protein
MIFEIFGALLRWTLTLFASSCLEFLGRWGQHVAELEERKAAASARTDKRKLRKKKRDEKKAQGLVETTTQLPQSPLQQPDMLQQQMLMQQQLQQQPLEPTFQQQQMGAQQMVQQPLEPTFQQLSMQQPLEPTFQSQQLASGVATAQETAKMTPPQPEFLGPAGTSSASMGNRREDHPRHGEVSSVDASPQQSNPLYIAF